MRELATALIDAFPALDDLQRRIALATYRRLARGVPAAPEEIAADAGVAVEQVRRVLADWIGVYSDCENRVIAFWGLALPPMKHRLEVDGVNLHAWCAWDTLFLPELLGKTMRVESACATSGESVHLTVSPAGVESADPTTLFISFICPDASGFRTDIVRNFCHFVHFFRSRADGEAWVAQNPGTFLLTLDEAVELARRKNQAQFFATEPQITLIYDADCPNAPEARAALREALTRFGLEPTWIEYDRGTSEVPERFVGFGSPTILVDGDDVAGERALAAAASCRVYEADGGFRGVPPVEAIVAALTEARRRFVTRVTIPTATDGL